MRLHDAVIVEGRPVADLDQVPFEEASRADIDAAADLRAEQPQVPGEQGSASQRVERERRSKEFVKRVHELETPDEPTPERTDERPVATHDGPLRQRDPQNHRAAASRINERQQQERRAKPKAGP